MQTIEQLFFSLLQNFDTPYKRYFFERVDFQEKLIGILGDRGIGKTTFLLQHLKESPLKLHQKLYVSAEYIGISNISLFEMAKEFHSKGGKLLVVDEIHKLVDFETELKLIYDYIDLKVIFSGSSAIKLEHLKADLSRRAMLYRFQGLSFREFLELKLGSTFSIHTLDDIVTNHIEIAYEISSKLKPLEHFKEYLEYGYYPFYFNSPKQNFHLKLNETINTTIEFDLSHIFNIEPRFTIKLKQLVSLIAQSKPYELNISKLAQKIEINRNTLYQYIYYLGRGNLFNIIYSKTKGDAIFTKPQKLYLANTNLNFAYSPTIEAGAIRETFFANQLNEEHTLEYPNSGDFLVDSKYTFEVGGKGKEFVQIKDIESSFVVIDDVEIGSAHKIPLWLFGFLY